MKQLVTIEAVFLMDPSDTYQHLYQFQYEIKEFFNSKGMDIEPINSVGGQNGKLMMFIYKKKDDPKDPKKSAGVKPLIASVKTIQAGIDKYGTNRPTG